MITYAKQNLSYVFIAYASGMVVIDRFGRRRLLLLSLTGVIIALAVLTSAFHVAAHDSPSVNFSMDNSFSSLICTKQTVVSRSHCTGCLQAGCGFCADSRDEVKLDHLTKVLFTLLLCENLVIHANYTDEYFLFHHRICQACAWC